MKVFGLLHSDHGMSVDSMGDCNSRSEGSGMMGGRG